MSIFKDKKCFTDSELMEMLEEAMEVGVKKTKAEFTNAQLEKLNENFINDLKDKIKVGKSRISTLTKENSDIKNENIKLKKQLSIEKSNSKTFLETIFEQQKLLEKISIKLQLKDIKLYEVVNQLIIKIKLPNKKDLKIKNKDSVELEVEQKNRKNKNIDILA